VRTHVHPSNKESMNCPSTLIDPLWFWGRVTQSVPTVCRALCRSERGYIFRLERPCTRGYIQPNSLSLCSSIQQLVDTHCCPRLLPPRMTKSSAPAAAVAAGLLGAASACCAKASQGCLSLEGRGRLLCMLAGYGLMLCVSVPCYDSCLDHPNPLHPSHSGCCCYSLVPLYLTHRPMQP
jgi:hypothetical protein